MLNIGVNLDLIRDGLITSQVNMGIVPNQDTMPAWTVFLEMATFSLWDLGCNFHHFVNVECCCL